jgi:FKBP-type peptidyl-prolyl cis-trans isomerase
VQILYECLSPEGELYDAILKKKQALKFRKGLHQTIEGIDQGIEGMRIGGAREIIVPPHLG